MSAGRHAEGDPAFRPGTIPRAPALIAAGLCLLLAGCGSLLGTPPPAPRFWSLDAAPAVPSASASTSASAPASATRASAPVLIVAKPRAAAGFDTDRIVYVREEHRLEPYADNQWIDAPQRMLGPLIADALARTGAFGAVLATPSPANGQWELDTEIVRLQHEVGAQRVRFTLRATLVNRPLRTAVVSREFDAVAPTPATNPAGAVAAANVAVAEVLGQLTAFCVEATRAGLTPG
jgi:cholesterol transport system auxiliary component